MKKYQLRLYNYDTSKPGKILRRKQKQGCMCYTCYYDLFWLWKYARLLKFHFYRKHLCRFQGHKYYSGCYNSVMSWKTWCMNCGAKCPQDMLDKAEQEAEKIRKAFNERNNSKS